MLHDDDVMYSDRVVDSVQTCTRTTELDVGVRAECATRARVAAAAATSYEVTVVGLPQATAHSLTWARVYLVNVGGGGGGGQVKVSLS